MSVLQKLEKKQQHVYAFAEWDIFLNNNNNFP